jgi:uroporphyrinogen decarboxylase
VPDAKAARVQKYCAVQGHLDPILLVAGGEAMRDRVREILAAFAGGPHIFNLGHGIVPNTPIEHVAELVRLVRDGAAR